MIIGDPYRIAIQIEQIDMLCSPSGMFNFIINDQLLPGKGTAIDLFIVISSLKESLERGLININGEIGNIPIELMDFSQGEPKLMIPLNVAELYDFGCNFWLGYDGGDERLIYTLDFEKSFRESRYPRGTVSALIRSLPEAGDLIMEKNNSTLFTRSKY